jgi:hypothetical protein
MVKPQSILSLLSFQSKGVQSNIKASLAFPTKASVIGGTGMPDIATSDLAFNKVLQSADHINRLKSRKNSQ